ncbi:Ger(x)C family spore germination protein [Anoxybacillus sp. J5B_2022]|uniref:Ger(x)C family spore germination protein n=1 Tax=Anoxybacillus sp. J5B_2022 TaxID=3003246 RepID=UPI00228610A0|nr:Ger(x)C family spore germination protein [Anoxybacillus sp. J5B_2022]MCZ0754276.1 Ger(x)C family spore germination protein [Anoxybacillus sp. J5B_2022]
MKCTPLPLLLCAVFLLSGCGMNTKLDSLTMTLTLGLDVTDDGKLLMYSSSPVFNKDAKEHTEVIEVDASSLREGRYKVDLFASGRTVGGKIQNVVIGKKLVQQKELLSFLDVLYRDPKNSTTALLIIYDGPVKELIESKQKDKPRLAVAIKDLITTTALDKQTVKTNLLDFHRTLFEKGCMPFASEMAMKNGKMTVKGVALFNNKGKYVTSLSSKESAFLQLLRNEIKPAIPFTLRTSALTGNGKKENISVSLEHGKVRYQTRYRNDRFQFHIHIDAGTIITEEVVNVDMRKKQKQLEKMIAKEIENKTKALIKTFQKHEIDPIGFGLYARAYEYRKWKKVENDWGKAFAAADISVSAKVNIISYGVIN